MKKLIITLFISVGCINDFELEGDELVVWMILDLNGLQHIFVDSMASINRNGRVFGLDMDYLRLTVIPPEIGLHTELDTLHLFHDWLLSLPAEIGQLANLQVLILAVNGLKSLPPERGQLTQLTNLDLGSNQLTISPEIVQLTQLTELKLKHSKLTSLPLTICQITPTILLDLSYNKLDTNNLSKEILDWADKYDPGWCSTQSPTAINYAETGEARL